MIKYYVYEKSTSFINYLVSNNIYYNFLDKKKDYYIIITSYDNYKRISILYKTSIIRYYGKKFYINFLIVNKYILVSFFISLVLLFLLCNTIFKININTSDENLKDIISDSLKNYGIEVYKKKLSFDELNKIKNKILKDNKDTLEWIEINEIGCRYDVNVTPRVVKNNEEKDSTPSSIVASKDGRILHINSTSGTELKEINDYVKKGDILISGNIFKGDKVTNQVKAEGLIYAEVWYTVNITIPFKYREYTETGKVINHYYLDIYGTKFTLLGKYDSKNTINTKKLILDKPYLLFKLYREEKREYEYKEFNLNEDEAYSEALKRSENKIKNKLNKDEYIISKKVLKKEVNSSKMYVEVFFKVYENIGVTSNIEIIGEEDESSN